MKCKRALILDSWIDGKVEVARLKGRKRMEEFSVLGMKQIMTERN